MASAAARVSKARGAGAGERIREREMVCIVVKDGRSGRTAGEETTETTPISTRGNPQSQSVIRPW